MDNILPGFEDMQGMDVQGLMAKFEELEARWKIEPSLEGLKDIFSIYGVSQTEDLVPQTIYDLYKTTWNTYTRIRGHIEDVGDDAALSDEDKKRFANFQEILFHSQACILSFMRSCNCNGAFPVPETPEVIFWYSPCDFKGMKDIHTLIVHLLGRLQDMRLRRSGGYVYQQVFMGNRPTHAWEEKCDIPTMIRTLCDRATHWEMWKHSTVGGNFDACVRYLTNCLDVEFPDLNIKRRVWSFNDGIYDASDDSFVTYDQPINEHLVSCKIIKKDFIPHYYSGHPLVSSKLAYEQLKTPKFDSIFEPQNWDDEMLKWMFVFIGRLFYEVNEMDSWQVIPFMKGVAGTGKSTVIKVVQLMYNMRDIGVISNNIEKKFGLSTIFNKTLFVIPELKGDFAMDQADFQSMVTGEELSLAQKNKAPLTGQWTVPGIMAGNESAGWEDKSGSISRRIVVFDFPNKVPLEKLNPNLINEIKEEEIPTIIRKSALAYHDALSKYRGGDIWSVLPQRVCEEKKRLQFSTNPLYAFINSDQLVLDTEEYTLESTFISKLKAFATLKFPNSVITFTPDFYSYIFSDFGLYIKRDTLPWPPSSATNIQCQSYLFGCRVCDNV